MERRLATRTWTCIDQQLDLQARPLVMGILNVTPDSFSDGGRWNRFDAARSRAEAMLEAGADMLDVGGESTRPGAVAVSAEEERARVIPVIREIHRVHPQAVISIDTTKADVARAAVDAGASIINDVSAGEMDTEMAKLAAESRAGIVLMHMRGNPRTMQDNPQYDHVVEEVCDYLARRVEHFEAQGVASDAIVLDPGMGFGKTRQHNLELLAGISDLTALGYPVLIGLSRKRFLGDLTGRKINDRLAASLAGLSYAVTKGARVLRVHDVAESVDAVRVLTALQAEEVPA